MSKSLGEVDVQEEFVTKRNSIWCTVLEIWDCWLYYLYGGSRYMDTQNASIETVLVYNLGGASILKEVYL